MTENPKTFKAPTGTKDILPDEAWLWQSLEEKAGEIFALYGYKPIRTPILENSSLFNRSLGEETEIVKKQMFLVEREKETFCLRPEATAAIVRAYLENNLDKTSSFIKLCYAGPMFRAERPQKGRLRQFHHLGVEALGSLSPYLDSEIIELADRILTELNITGYQIKINSLGCPPDKQKFSQLLRQKLKEKLSAACEDCKERFSRNVFRVLDCKNPGCKEIVNSLNLQYNDYLCAGCAQHYQAVKSNLDKLKVNYLPTVTLVRGLDYYSRTVFEISHPDLGAQDALGAGGRYDTLIAALGGPETGAIGFAFGIERLLLASKLTEQAFRKNVNVFVISLGEEAKREGFLLLNKLRREKISCDMDYEDKSLKAQMRKANDAKVAYVLLLGENELKKQAITLKDMQQGNQDVISLENVISELKKRLRLCSAHTPAQS